MFKGFSYNLPDFGAISHRTPIYQEDFAKIYKISEIIYENPLYNCIFIQF
nr:MAG TPA: hypothetical protein [Caudoviricetes sp.]